MDSRFVINLFTLILCLVLASCTESADDAVALDDAGNLNVAVPHIIRTTKMNLLELDLMVTANGQSIQMTNNSSNPEEPNWAGSLEIPYGDNLDMVIRWQIGDIVLATMDVQQQNIVLNQTLQLVEDAYLTPDWDNDGFSNLAEINATPPTGVNDANSLPGNPSPGNDLPYAVGDTGPAGGVVFYVSADLRLEVAPEDAGTATWGCYSEQTLNAPQGAENLSVPGTDFRSVVGFGQENSRLLILSCTPANAAHTVGAAVVADGYTYNGFTDWYLPSRWELQVLHRDQPLINLNNLTYWSSSQLAKLGEEHNGWAVGYPSGVVLITKKIEGHAVRAIRSF